MALLFSRCATTWWKLSPSPRGECADVETDRIFFLALLKLVEIVGEAATRISAPMQAAHP